MGGVRPIQLDDQRPEAEPVRTSTTVGGGSLAVDAAAWWFPAAAIAAFATLAWLLQSVLSFLITGRGGSPAVWRHTQVVTDAAEMERLREFVAAQCATQASKYRFGMELHDAWRVENSALDASFADFEAAHAAADKERNVRRLFHGSLKDNVHAIHYDGFRLPIHAGMFGKGVYFADCPLKSLQYAGLGFCCGGRRYMLVCDVELGHYDGGERRPDQPGPDARPPEEWRREAHRPAQLRLGHRAGGRGGCACQSLWCTMYSRLSLGTCSPSTRCARGRRQSCGPAWGGRTSRRLRRSGCRPPRPPPLRRCRRPVALLPATAAAEAAAAAAAGRVRRRGVPSGG